MHVLYRYYLYDDVERYCVTARECSEMGRYAYTTSGECSALGPDLSRDTLYNVPNEIGALTCVTDTIMFKSDKVQCISV